jgi:hypothetical protein
VAGVASAQDLNGRFDVTAPHQLRTALDDRLGLLAVDFGVTMVRGRWPRRTTVALAHVLQFARRFVAVRAPEFDSLEARRPRRCGRNQLVVLNTVEAYRESLHSKLLAHASARAKARAT